ncbi:unnamed protein product [Amaranthus hypochondriacus]
MASFQWANDSKPVSFASKFIVPDENKPNFTNKIDLGVIPIINMNENTEIIVEKITKACEEFGFFQVINHGIPKELCEKVLDVITTFFEQSYEEKADLVSQKHMEDGKIFKYYIKDQETQEKIPMWGEAFYHTWHPLDFATFIHKLPLNPPHYRDTIGEYAKEIGVLMTQMFSLLSQGLGLDKDYLEKSLRRSYTAQANYYPPCPHPELTLGLRDHTDFNILTFLLQDEDVTGLQIFKDGNWMDVDPVPNSIVINVGDQLQVLSNDKFKSVLHRAVTNQNKKRVSFAMFVGPNHKDLVEPIPDLVREAHPSKYRKYRFEEFIQEFRNQQGKFRRVKEVFRIDH